MIHLKLETRRQTKEIAVLGKQSWIILVLGVRRSLVGPQLFLAALTAGALPKYYYLCSSRLLRSFFRNTIDTNSGFLSWLFISLSFQQAQFSSSILPFDMLRMEDTKK